jgi:hypothetical protein
MKRNLFALFGSVAVLITATAASITASAQTSGTEQSPIAQAPTDPMVQQQDQTIQERGLVRSQAHAEEEGDFLNILD